MKEEVIDRRESLHLLANDNLWGTLLSPLFLLFNLKLLLAKDWIQVQLLQI